MMQIFIMAPIFTMFSFFSINKSANSYQFKNPTRATKNLHNLQMQSLPFQILIVLSKDKSGMIKSLLKRNFTKVQGTRYAIQNSVIVSSFHVLMPPTFINLSINLRKLGQTSLPFCILYECVKAR